jgi:hypothetical protein
VCGLILLLISVGIASGQCRPPKAYGPGFDPFPEQGWYARAEYLAMWGKGNRLPPLLTTSPQGTPQVDAGVLGEPGTEVLFGDERVADRGRQGARLTFGKRLGVYQRLSWEVEWFYLGDANEEVAAGFSEGDPIVARPFFNRLTGVQDSQLVAFPGLAGGIQFATHSEVQSVDVLLRYNWWEGPHGYLNVFTGYRFFRFQEGLEIQEQLFGLVDVFDRFETENNFHGVDLGGTLGLGTGPWLLETTANVAVGNVHQELQIDGFTDFAGTVTGGGWLSAPSNIGDDSDDRFAAIPELGMRVSYVGWKGIRIIVGYELIFITNVLRTGDQIDTTVNPTQLAPLPLARGGGIPSAAPRPTAQLKDTAMWLQGINLALEASW